MTGPKAIEDEAIEDLVIGSGIPLP